MAGHDLLQGLRIVVNALVFYCPVLCMQHLLMCKVHSGAGVLYHGCIVTSTWGAEMSTARII